MASSSKAQSFNPRFYDYLNGLQKEFELRSNVASTKSSSPQRFNIFVGNLKGEFELMALDLESVREEREVYKEKVEAQAKELQNVRRNPVCEQCGKATSTPQIISPSQLKTKKAASSSSSRRHIPRSKPVQSVVPQQATRRKILVRKLQSLNTRAPQSIPNATSRSPDIDSQTVSLPSPLPRDPSPIRFNKKVKKELDLEMAHGLYHEEWISCIKFSQDGKYLAVGCEDGKAYIYDVQTGTVTCVLRNLLAEQDYLGAVCFSCDGKYLATGSLDRNIYVWEIRTRYVRNAFKGHTRCILSVNFSPNGRQLVSASGDNTARIWNMRGGAATILAEENHTDDDNLSCSSAIFSPDGRYIAASYGNGVVRIWDVRTGTSLRRVKAHIDWVDAIAFMPDGKGLLSGSRDTTLRYWDLSSFSTTGKFPRQRDLHTGVEEQTRPHREFSGHTGHIYSIAISPNGRWVASGSGDTSVRIWDSHSGDTQCILKDDDSVWTLDISPAGSHLAFGGPSGTVNIWKYSSIIGRLRSKAAKSMKGNKDQ